ncbi:helix-turn-helix domain-containing protein [Sulfitobacter sp. D7]|uniref:helix-turn-helix domain-containing protein n=1 Tax=Sulfitobacter sp. D7 TaxID=1968541 RepID=UPI0013C476C1
MNKKYYSPAQLAERWKCSPNTVRNLINSGELPSFRIGQKLIRISAADVKEYENA